MVEMLDENNPESAQRVGAEKMFLRNKNLRAEKLTEEEVMLVCFQAHFLIFSLID